MKFYQIRYLLATIVITSPIALLSGCANPYDIHSCEGGRYQPPHYDTYADSSYYDNDYYKNFEKDHFQRGDHRYDHTYGPNQLYHPSENP